MFTATASYIHYVLKNAAIVFPFVSLSYANETCRLFLHHFIQKLGWIFAVHSVHSVWGDFAFAITASYIVCLLKAQAVVCFPWQAMQTKCVDCSSIALFESYSQYS